MHSMCAVSVQPMDSLWLAHVMLPLPMVLLLLLPPWLETQVHAEQHRVDPWPIDSVQPTKRGREGERGDPPRWRRRPVLPLHNYHDDSNNYADPRPPTTTTTTTNKSKSSDNSAANLNNKWWAHKITFFSVSLFSHSVCL